MHLFVNTNCQAIYWLLTGICKSFEAMCAHLRKINSTINFEMRLS